MKKILLSLILIFCLTVLTHAQNSIESTQENLFQNLNTDDFIYNDILYHVIFNKVEDYYDLSLERQDKPSVKTKNDGSNEIIGNVTKHKIVFYVLRKDVFKWAVVTAINTLQNGNDSTFKVIDEDKKFEARIDLLYDNFKKYDERYELLFRLEDTKEQAGIFEFKKDIDVLNIKNENYTIDSIRLYLDGIKRDIVTNTVKNKSKGKVKDGTGIDERYDSKEACLKNLRNNIEKLEFYKFSRIKWKKPNRYINKTILIATQNDKYPKRRLKTIYNSIMRDIILYKYASEFEKNGYNKADFARFSADTSKAINAVNSNNPNTNVFTANTPKNNNSFENNDKHKPTVKKLKILIQDGTIKDIEAIVEIYNNSNLYAFTNYYPIPLQSKYDISQLNKKLLFTKDIGSGYYLKVGNLLHYETYGGNLSNDYSPEDQYLEITEENWQSKVKVNKFGLNDYLNIKLYSDLIGLSDEQPNGLLQFETAIKMPIKGVMIPNSKFSFFEDISWYINFMKIEENDNILSNTYYGINTRWVEGTDSVNNVNTLDLLRYANFGTGIYLNVARFKTAKKIFEYSLDIGGGLIMTKALDAKLQVVENLTSFFINPKFNIFIRPGSNIGLDITLGLSGIQLNTPKQFAQTSKNLSNNYVTEYKPDELGEADKWTLSPSIMAYYHPLGNKYSKIYIRGIYHKMIKNSENFLQIQVGYSLSISDLLSRQNYKGANF